MGNAHAVGTIARLWLCVRNCCLQIALSTDLIMGFCGETEEDHAQSLDLLRTVEFDQAFLFAYSLREKTHAARHLQASGTHCPSAPLSSC